MAGAGVVIDVENMSLGREDSSDKVSWAKICIWDAWLCDGECENTFSKHV